MPHGKVDISSFILEITGRCNRRCMFCYNVWKCPGADYPAGEELSTEQVKAVILKLKQQTRIRYLAISGGEPCLRPDIAEIIAFSSGNLIQTNLLTNGSLLTEDRCQELVKANTSIFEVPVLTMDPALHHRLTGSDDLHEVIQGVRNLKEHRATVVLALVLTRLNAPDVKRTIEHMIALGCDGIMLNRFNAGGEGLRHVGELMPSVEDVLEVLGVLDDMAGYYGVKASASVPIPKCILGSRRYRHLGFGHCPSGGRKSYLTIDPYGHVRVCNHSPVILGNLLHQDVHDIMRHRFLEEFARSWPPYCQGCKELKSCWGGCKASAHVCSGSLTGMDPFLQQHLQATWTR